MPQPPHRPLRSFGRLKSRPIKPRQAELLETLLPRVRFDPIAGQVQTGALMTDAAEVWLEVGFGGGEHMAEQAARRPDVLVLGAEPFLNGAASALRHIEARGLGNVRLYIGDVRDVIVALPAASLDRMFILFPDPWPKARHHKRRLVDQAFVGEVARVLRPGGRLRFATDWADYANVALERFTACIDLSFTAERADDWRLPPADHVTTRYEQKKLGDILAVFFDFVRT